MFHEIPQAVIDRMLFLEEADALDRADGTPHLQRLRQIPPETGRLVAILAASSPSGRIIEIGTSAGYSTLWIALAARATGRTVTTYEILPDKVAKARETMGAAALEAHVEIVEGDALEFLSAVDQVGFCFLDAEKQIYLDCYESVVPGLVPGGLLVADNAISHRSALQPMIDRAMSDRRVDSVIVPIGKGLLLARKL
jgi:predicted O-methyltransferase YrrM